MDILRKNAAVLAWLLFGFAIAFAFWQVDRSRQESRREICRSQLESALTLRDLIDFSVSANPNPGAQAVIQKFYDRIELPPEICKNTNVDVAKFFQRARETPTVTSTTTTSTTSTSVVKSSSPSSSSTSKTAQGPSPVRRTRSPTTTTTVRPSPTTTTTTTTTTTPSPPCFGQRILGKCVVG